jgi:hypothetical protein
MYVEHIEEMYKLFKENNPKSAIKAKDIAEEVIGILYDQGEIDDAKADDPQFIESMTEQVKYICNLRK